jgi:hypothetical protein
MINAIILPPAAISPIRQSQQSHQRHRAMFAEGVNDTG